MTSSSFECEAIPIVIKPSPPECPPGPITAFNGCVPLPGYGEPPIENGILVGIAYEIGACSTVSRVTVFLGNGDGTFETAFQATVITDASFSTFPNSLAVGDFNGDGVLDLVATSVGFFTDTSGGTASVLLGNGDGIFQAAIHYAAGAGVGPLAVADFDGDGLLDLAVADWSVGAIFVLLGAEE